MLTEHKNGASINFYSTDKLYIDFKARMLEAEGYEVSRRGVQKSGYGGTKTIYNLSTLSDAKAKSVADADIEELLSSLTKEDLILWYLDDGSWHKVRNTMHLYSNMLDEQQTDILIGRIGDLYGISPRIRTDRKKDGRAFYYLYFPRELVRLAQPEVRQFISDNGIESMYYKVGGKSRVESASYYLEPDEVRAIRRMGEAEGKSIAEIASVVGMEYSRVNRILSYKTYKDVV